MENGVAEYEVEALVGEKQLLGLGANRLGFDAEALSGGAERRQHSRRDVAGRQAPDDAELQEVEAEIAGAGADLERVAERTRVADRLAQLAADLVLADLAEVDPPLAVVLVRRGVVVARVDVLDVLGRGRG
jgi:hypothetical protein